jgi:hypothetical protein
MRHHGRIVVVIAAVALASPAVALASTRTSELGAAVAIVRTTVATEMRGAPDVDGKVVSKIPVGRTVDVLGRRGRWVEVRHRGRHGWVLRSALDGNVAATELSQGSSPSTDPGTARTDKAELKASKADAKAAAKSDVESTDEAADDETRGSRRRKGSKRERPVEREEGFDDELADAEPTRKTDSGKARSAKKAAITKATTKVATIKAAPTRAAVKKEPKKAAEAPETTARKPPKVARTTKVRRTTVAASEERLDEDVAEDDDLVVDDASDDRDDPVVMPSLLLDSAPRAPTMLIGLRAGGGYTATGMTRASATGDGGTLSRFAGPSADVGVRVSREVGPVRVGVDAGLLWGFGGALRHQSTGGEVSDTQARQLAATGVVTVGRGDKLRAAGRLGYHHGQISVATVDNMAQLPSEILAGPVVGAEAGATYGKLDVGLVIDMLVKGSVQQAAGLEDGVAGSPLAGIARAELSYLLGRHLSVSARYRLDVARTRFTGDSVRLPGTTDTTRSDQSHTALVGVDLGL